MDKTLYEAIEAQKKIKEMVMPFANFIREQKTLADKINEITAPARKLAELTNGINAPIKALSESIRKFN